MANPEKVYQSPALTQGWENLKDGDLYWFDTVNDYAKKHHLDKKTAPIGWDEEALHGRGGEGMLRGRCLHRHSRQQERQGPGHRQGRPPLCPGRRESPGPDRVGSLCERRGHGHQAALQRLRPRGGSHQPESQNPRRPGGPQGHHPADHGWERPDERSDR